MDKGEGKRKTKNVIRKRRGEKGKGKRGRGKGC